MIGPRTIAGWIVLACLATLVAALAVVEIAASVMAGEDEFGTISAIVLGALVLGGLVALAVAVVLGRAISGPIVALTQRAERPPREAEAFPDQDGPEEVRRLAAALRHMSEGLRREREHAEAERDRLAALVGELSDAILIVDPDDRVRLANAAAERMLKSGALAGRRLVEVVREHEAHEVIARARAGAEAVAHVERQEPRRFLRVLAKPLAEGQLLLVLQDLSALRRLETVRRDFIANVSHELRTPIASLKVMAETLQEGAVEDAGAARDFVGRMQREIDGLAQLVGELLSLSRLEAGQEELRLLPCEPRELLEAAVRRMAPLAARAEVSLEVADLPELPAVMVDEEKVSQVLANLVHNAVKFTPTGGQVRLSAERRDGKVAFSITDTGAGMDPALTERVFERFFKSDEARAGGGTGLGLAIAKHIVQAHGGEIRAQSEGPGRGSTFTFTLPAVVV